MADRSWRPRKSRLRCNHLRGILSHGGPSSGRRQRRKLSLHARGNCRRARATAPGRSGNRSVRGPEPLLCTRVRKAVEDHGGAHGRASTFVRRHAVARDAGAALRTRRRSLASVPPKKCCPARDERKRSALSDREERGGVNQRRASFPLRGRTRGELRPLAWLVAGGFLRSRRRGRQCRVRRRLRGYYFLIGVSFMLVQYGVVSTFRSFFGDPVTTAYAVVLMLLGGMAIGSARLRSFLAWSRLRRYRLAATALLVSGAALSFCFPVESGFRARRFAIARGRGHRGAWRRAAR